MDFRKLYKTIGSEYEPVIERFCGQNTILGKFVLQFPEDSTFRDLSTAIADGDYNQVECQAHTLKGVTGNLGFTKLMEASGELVLCVRHGQLEEVPEIFGRVAAEYETVCRAISDMTEE